MRASRRDGSSTWNSEPYEPTEQELAEYAEHRAAMEDDLEWPSQAEIEHSRPPKAMAGIENLILRAECGQNPHDERGLVLMSDLRAVGVMERMEPHTSPSRGASGRGCGKPPSFWKISPSAGHYRGNAQDETASRA